MTHSLICHPSLICMRQLHQFIIASCSYAGIANGVYSRLDYNVLCNWITPADPGRWGIPGTASNTRFTGP